MSKNAIAYYRISTNKQRHSINNQKEVIKEYCSENNINIILEVEEVCSGIKKYQNKLSDTLEMLKRENCILVCSCPDRLTREYSFGKHIIENYDVIFCSDPNMDYETKLNELYFAEKEVKKIRERTKNILNRLKTNGVKLGNPNATFTKEQIEKANIVVKERANKNENNLKAKIFVQSLLISTKNYSEIARKLNENGFKTRGNKEFYATTVKRLIKRYNL